MRAEVRVLVARFGRRFPSYCAAVRRWL